MTLDVLDGQGKTVWTQEIIGRKSLNQLRWDLAAERRESPQPYFTAHVTFIEVGTYELRITGDGRVHCTACGKDDLVAQSRTHLALDPTPTLVPWSACRAGCLSAEAHDVFVRDSLPTSKNR